MVNNTPELFSFRNTTSNAFQCVSDRTSAIFDFDTIKESFPTLLITMLAQNVCGKLMENILYQEISIKHPIIFIVDCVIIFLGNYQVVFIINIINASNMTFDYENVEGCPEISKEIPQDNKLLKNVKNTKFEKISDQKKNKAPFYNLPNKSSKSLHLKTDKVKVFSNGFKKLCFNSFLNLLKQCFLVSFVIATSSTAIRIMLYPFDVSIFAFYLNLYILVSFASLISSSFTFLLIVSSITLCKYLQINPDNVVLPIITSINEILTILTSFICFKNFIDYNIGKSFTCILFLSGLFILILKLSGKDKNINENINENQTLKVSKPPFYIILLTFISSIGSSFILEYFSKNKPNVASISMVYCGTSVSVLMIYLNHVCTKINKIYERDQKPQSFKHAVNEATRKTRKNFFSLILLTALMVSMYIFLEKMYVNLLFSFLLFSVFLFVIIFAGLFLRFLFIFENQILKKSEEKENDLSELLSNGELGGVSIVILISIIDNLGFIFLIGVLKFFYK